MTDLVDEIPDDFHSERSPSSAHRWRLCWGSVEEERGLPDSVGEEAIQGTCFHEVAAICLEFGVDPWPFVGTMIDCGKDGEREFTREMAIKMMPGLITIRAMADAPGCHMFVERRVHLDNWIGPGESGTADCFIIDLPNMRIINWDWKWGIGVPVSPVKNDQTMLYTLGVWDDYAYELFHDYLTEQAEEAGETFNDNDPWEDSIEVVIVIEQPRAPGGGGVWETTIGWLLEEGKRIRKDADETQKPGAKRTPGPKQCGFCKAARFNTCKARKEYLLDLLEADSDDLETSLVTETPPEIVDRRVLSPEERSTLILHAPMIKSFLDQLKAEADEDAMKGRPTPGLKLVKGRHPARKWKDEGRAELQLLGQLGSKAYGKPKLLSPSQLQDEVGKKAYLDYYAELVDEGQPSLILVSESDPREREKTLVDLLDDDSIM